ncbi:MAG: hypothetical protein ACSLEN_09725 [Candidatus Malihini olakiniferum]
MHEPKIAVGKTCRSDMKVCHDKLYALDMQQLKQLCEDYIEAACSS